MNKGTLGNSIRNARIKMGLSQEQLAEQVGITPTHVKHLESEHRLPSTPVLFKIVTLLNISLDSILFPMNDEISDIYNELEILTKKCSKKQIQFLIDVVQSMNANL
ncbi:MAG: helix-turn-helix domain-containing protein [Lachnospiraceae bacterium]|nr:helix-turn-helix domain-containing protein [Lachnospiraceae bacterium]